MDIYHFLDNQKGQIAIYDAVNPLAEGRRQLAKEFAKHDIQVRSSYNFAQIGWLIFLTDHFHRVLCG